MSQSVDALVSETPSELKPQAGTSTESRAYASSITSSAPPGLPLPDIYRATDVVPDQSSESQIHSHPAGTTSNVSTSAVVPVIPVLPIISAQLTSPPKKDQRSTQPPVSKQPKSSPAKSATDDYKQSSNGGQTTAQAAVSSTKSPKRTAMAGSSRAKNAAQTTSKAQESESTTSIPDPKSVITHAAAKVHEVMKRQHPGKLDITAATEASKQSHTSSTSSAYKASEMTTKISQGNLTPSSSGPRTIRVLPTPKLEALSAGPASAGLPAVASPLASSKLPSRQPSLTSINRPGTPIGELISDNASMTSTSMSRANSPPPSKVGIAPVRQTTKSQQKKERQARAKVIEDTKKVEEIVEKVVPEESVQAPIIGRKKKTKKSTIDATASSTPVHSRPASPVDKENMSVAAEPEKPVPVVPAKEPKKEPKKELAKAQEKKTPESSATAQAPTASDPSQRNSLTPASIIGDLQAHGDLDSVAMLQFFTNIPGINHRHDINSADFLDLDRKIVLSDEERVHLAQGHPVHLVPSSDKTSSRMMVSPAGAFLRGLSAEQEERFVELEKETMSITGPAKFNPSRHSNEAGTRPFQLYQDVAGSGGATHQHEQQRAAADSAVGRKLDEALNYVNQFLDSSSTALPDGGNGSQAQKMKTGGGYEMDDAGGHRGYQAPRAQQQQWASDRPLMSVEEAEVAMQVARKETEALEKRLNGLLKKNRRFVFGSVH